MPTTLEASTDWKYRLHDNPPGPSATKGPKAPRQRADRDRQARATPAGRRLEAVRDLAHHLHRLVAGGRLAFTPEHGLATVVTRPRIVRELVLWARGESSPAAVSFVAIACRSAGGLNPAPTPEDVVANGVREGIGVSYGQRHFFRNGSRPADGGNLPREARFHRKETSVKPAFLQDLPLAGELVSSDFADWPEEIREEFRRNEFNGVIGSKLLSETDRVRVWEVRVAPGERLGSHRHVLDYFWTAITAGRSRQRTFDGTTREVCYVPGETRHFHFGRGEFLLHDLENIGDTELVFTTVEFKDGENAPLPLG